MKKSDMEKSPEYYNRIISRLSLSVTGSNIADGMLLGIFPLLAVRITQSPFEIALIALLTRICWLLVSLPAGMLADHLCRFKIVLSSQLLRVTSLILAAILMWQNMLGFYGMCAIVLICSFSEVLADTTTPTIGPNLLTKKYFRQYNAKMALFRKVSNDCIGIPLGVYLLDQSDFLAFIVPCSLYGFSVLILKNLPFSDIARRKNFSGEADILGKLAKGFSTIFNNSSLKNLTFMALIGNFSTFGMMSLLVLHLRTNLGLSELQSGYFLMIPASGMLLSYPFYKKLITRLGEYFSILFLVTLLSINLFILCFSTNLWIICLSFLLQGLCILLWSSIVPVFMQENIPGDLLGRTAAVRQTLAFGVASLSILIAGSLSTLTDIPTTFGILAVIILLKAPVFISTFSKTSSGQTLLPKKRSLLANKN